MCHKSQLNGHLHLEIVDRRRRSMKAKKKTKKKEAASKTWRVEGQTTTATPAAKDILIWYLKQSSKMIKCLQTQKLELKLELRLRLK